MIEGELPEKIPVNELKKNKTNPNFISGGALDNVGFNNISSTSIFTYVLLTFILIIIILMFNFIRVQVFSTKVDRVEIKNVS
jgi:hypothetical protein